jgi:fructan beta-fructosidase
MYEVIGGEGVCFKTAARRDMGQALGTISLTAEGGALTVESLQAFAMNSAWKRK